MVSNRNPEMEATRLAAIERFDILDTPEEDIFKRIVSIVAAVFNTNMAVITLVDTERSWHMAEIGFGVKEMPRSDEMCDTVISQDGVFIVHDSLLAPRDIVLPMLKAGLRFYAGTPLRTRDGIKIGTLCAIDPEPHEVTPVQEQILRDLSIVVIDEMELRLAARRIAAADEELRRLNARLSEMNRNKSEFLASMSHELRTPLHGILGASELLAQGLFGDLNAKQQEYVGDIQNSGSHLLQLIDDVLDLSRIEAGQFELHREPMDVALIMQASTALVRGLAAISEVELVVRPPAEELILSVDQRRITQVACNLLSNAIKFSGQGTKVDFAAWQEDGHVVFLIEDRGPGIPPELHERIFDQFYRITSDHEGTGLGLPLAKQLVELHEGRIWMESEPGRGSRFCFSLPLAAH